MNALYTYTGILTPTNVGLDNSVMHLWTWQYTFSLFTLSLTSPTPPSCRLRIVRCSRMGSKLAVFMFRIFSHGYIHERMLLFILINMHTFERCVEVCITIIVHCCCRSLLQVFIYTCFRRHVIVDAHNIMFVYCNSLFMYATIYGNFGECVQ